jgi:hypothetical protein
MEMTPFHGAPAELPEVPGFVATTLLGLGTHGAVWAAREQITGDVVALKIGQPAANGRAAHEADLLARLDHPHLIRLRRVVQTLDGTTALVLDFAAGGSLAAVVAARGPLQPGEAVTLLVPLAEALADLHDHAIAHGDLAPGNVLFSADGRPLLSDLGVSRILGARQSHWSTPGFSDPDPAADARASDVWGLGALAWFAVTGEPPPGPDHPSAPQLSADVPAALQVLIRECLSAEPRHRPSASDVAARAWDAAQAVPIELPPSVTRGDPSQTPLDVRLRLETTPSRIHADEPDGQGSGRRTRRPTRWHLAGAVLGCLVAGASYMIVMSAGRGETSAPPVRGSPAVSASSGTAAHGQASIAAVLNRIAAARAIAFERVSVRLLASADEPGSDAEQMDAELVRRLSEAGLHLEGLSYLITEVRVTNAGPGLLDVTALVTTSEHRQVGAAGVASGKIVRQVAAAGPQRMRLRLVDADRNGWLVRTVKPIPPSIG